MKELILRKIFFTSDWHLYHENIIRFCRRPFKSVKEMHKTLIEKYNNVIKEEDILYYLGDLTLIKSEYAFKVHKEVEKFKGTKHLIVGNHDDWKMTTYEKIGFSTIHNVFWFPYGGFTFYLAHDPSIYTCIENDPKAILLCGHVHKLFTNLLPDKRVINVGVDVWDFSPVSFDTILTFLALNDIKI